MNLTASIGQAPAGIAPLAPLAPAYVPSRTDTAILAHLGKHGLCGRDGLAKGIGKSRDLTHARLQRLIAAGLVEQMQVKFKGRGGARKLYGVAA